MWIELVLARLGGKWMPSFGWSVTPQLKEFLHNAEAISTGPIEIRLSKPSPEVIV